MLDTTMMKRTKNTEELDVGKSAKAKSIINSHGRKGNGTWEQSKLVTKAKNNKHV